MTRNQSPNRRIQQALAASAMISAFVLAAPALAQQKYPLVALPDDDDRDYWWYHQVVDPEVLQRFQDVIGAPGVPLAVELEGPARIAVIYPSQDVSDAWLRMYLAMTARLNEMQVPYEAVQYASGMDGHELQATYTDQVLQNADDFDYVIFGPTELSLQADNVKRLIDHPGLKVIVLNYDQPIQEWGDEQPLAYTGFSHLAGALIMCDYITENLGDGGNYALIRGTPGSIDNQRSGGLKDCLDEKSEWEMVYEHYGNFIREGGFDGTNLVLTGYPEVTLIHSASTAMAMGALSAVEALDRLDDVVVTGWGGTGEELEALRAGSLWATPMRMGDDWGTSVAEVIKADLEGRADDIPLVVLGRITIANRDMPADEIDALETEAFRYSGKGTIER